MITASNIPKVYSGQKFYRVVGINEMKIESYYLIAFSIHHSGEYLELRLKQEDDSIGTDVVKLFSNGVLESHQNSYPFHATIEEANRIYGKELEKQLEDQIENERRAQQRIRDLRRQMAEL